jgi:hypothetical protein
MKKLSLKLEDLVLQSLETCPAATEDRGTVLGLQDASYDPFAADTCGPQPYSSVSCDTYDAACSGGGDDPDFNRRIIVYQTTS